MAGLLLLSTVPVFAKPPGTAGIFPHPVDLTQLKQGDWVEHEWTWECGKERAKGTMRMACVRATDEEVWLEVCTDTSRGLVVLHRIERKTRVVKAAWFQRPGANPEPMRVVEPGPPRPRSEMEVSKAEGTSETTEVEVAGKKIAVEKASFTCDTNRGPFGEHHKVAIAVSDDVPFPRPAGPEKDPAFDGDVIQEAAPKIPWKTAPKLTGGVVSSESTTSSLSGDYANPTTRTQTLKNFGHDAKPSVLVDGETKND